MGLSCFREGIVCGGEEGMYRREELAAGLWLLLRTFSLN